MTTFLVQAENGIPAHDFGFTLLQAVKYANWRESGTHAFLMWQVDVPIEHGIYGLCALTGKRVEIPNTVVPVGSVEFVREALLRFYGVPSIHPLNIPKQLKTRHFLQRDVSLVPRKSNIRFDGQPKFIKEADKFKGIADIFHEKDYAKIPEGSLWVSNVVDLVSEWRVFVHAGKVRGVHHYVGDTFVLPDKGFIHEAVTAYHDAPGAYTLDVGVTEDGRTLLIEAHTFYSCGLYGFQDLAVLPAMFKRGVDALKLRGF